MTYRRYYSIRMLCSHCKLIGKINLSEALINKNRIKALNLFMKGGFARKRRT